MPILDIDLTKADVLPDGVYVATITGVEVKPSANNDNTLVNFKLAINSPEEYAGRILFNNTNFKVPFRIKSMMDAAKRPYTSAGFDPEVTIGAQINIQVGQRDGGEFGLQNTIVKAWAI